MGLMGRACVPVGPFVLLASVAEATRSVDVKVRFNMVQVHEHSTNGTRDVSKFYKVQTNGGGFMSMLNADAKVAGENSSSVHFGVHVQEIMEVVCNDTSVGYQLGVDHVLKSVRIGAQNEWHAFVGGGYVTNDNISVSTYSVYDKQHFFGKGEIALGDLDGHEYVKYDFAIRKWAYSPLHPASVLVLKVLVIADDDEWTPAPFSAPGVGGINVGSDDSRGFFTWKQEAVGCPWGVSVGSSCHSNSTTDISVKASHGHGKWMYYTFLPTNGSLRGDVIWDPEQGAVLSASSPPVPVLPAVETAWSPLAIAGCAALGTGTLLSLVTVGRRRARQAVLGAVNGAYSRVARERPLQNAVAHAAPPTSSAADYAAM